MHWINHWSWLILASVLVFLEITLPTGYFIWGGIAAFLMASVVYVFPELHFLWQILLFACLASVFVTAYKMYLIRNPHVTEKTLLNRKSQQYIGQTVTLIEAIKNGTGKIKMHDVIWKVHGSDQAKDTNVQIVAVKNTTFIVEPIAKNETDSESI